MKDRNAPRTLHSTLGRGLAIAAWVGCAGVLIANSVSDGARGLVTVAAPVAFAAFVAWAVFWAPRVTVSADGLDVRNIFRRYRIHWSSVRSVAIGMALAVTTDHGSVTVWAAPAPSTAASRYGRPGAYGRMGSDSGDVAMFVRARWAELQRFGSVPALEAQDGIGYERHWYVIRIVVIVVLLAATIATAIETGADPDPGGVISAAAR